MTAPRLAELDPADPATPKNPPTDDDRFLSSLCEGSGRRTQATRYTGRGTVPGYRYTVATDEYYVHCPACTAWLRAPRGTGTWDDRHSRYRAEVPAHLPSDPDDSEPESEEIA
jgi:hypothetical protein